MPHTQKTIRSLALGLLLVLNGCLSAQKVQPTWESINQRGYPQWFSDAKLGIFIHWGLYSVPAYASTEGYAEWFYRGLMTNQEERVESLRPYLEPYHIDPFDTSVSAFDKYAVLTHYWKGELWNPDEWAQLFKDAGAQYILLVTKHHDGFCLWNSALQPQWNSMAQGPRRDIVGDLADAVRKKGIRFGAYYSLAEWTNPRHIWMQDPDDSIADYVDNYMIPQFKEMVEKYRPEVLFTDGEWNNNAEQWHARELIAWYYNTIGPDAVCNDRWGNGQQHGYRTPEYSAGITLTDRPWAECRGLGRSFGFNRNEPLENYLGSEELIRHFCKLVAAGGGMTLNVGPMADGTIPMLQQERLRDLGLWLRDNGDAIYGTRPWSERFYDFSTCQTHSLEAVIDHDWVRNSPSRQITYDNFTGDWEGTITPKYSENYTFILTADDTARFEIEADLPYRNAMTCAKDTQRVTIPLQAGRHYKVRVHFAENDLEARVSLKWQSPSQPLEAVAADSYGWNVVYRCTTPQVCYTTKGSDLYAITLNWQNKLTVRLPECPDKDMRVLFYRPGKGGSTMSLPWKWDKKNQQIVIYTADIPHSDLIESKGVWVFKLEGVIANNLKKSGGLR